MNISSLQRWVSSWLHAHLVLCPHLSLLQHHQRRVAGQRLEELLRVHHGPVLLQDQSQEVAGQHEHLRRLRRNTKESTDPHTEDVTSICLTSGVWCDLTCCSSSSSDDASRARRLLRLLVQTFRQRGWSEDRMWREMVVWTVDTDLPGERDRIHLHQTVSPFYPGGVNQNDQNL